ncbi:MAG: malonic semialdehyde reductase [Proteobacteria bacterium]|nr:malonic semialdehyde reductase [Burkholderiales bacterium]
MPDPKQLAIERALDLRTRFAGLDRDALALALEGLLSGARSHKLWLARPVEDAVLRELYDLMKWGPTSSNSSPARIMFIRTEAGKARLIPALHAGNVPKVRAAPVTAVIGYDMRFYDRLGELFPGADHATHFREHPETVEPCALRNGSLQGAWLMIAARALGLDVGPMSGFDNVKADEMLFAGTTVKSNFLVNLGYGDLASLPPRLPRLAFDEVCTLL